MKVKRNIKKAIGIIASALIIIFLAEGIAYICIYDISSFYRIEFYENYDYTAMELLDDDRIYALSDVELTRADMKEDMDYFFELMETCQPNIPFYEQLYGFDMGDLLLESEKGNVYFAFDTRELTRGDISARFGAYASALDKGFMQIDEVRELEDLPALGIDFIKLNLADSFYDPKTKRIYTPNTNQWTEFGGGGNAADNEEEPGMAAPEMEVESEVRFNENHDPENGRFTSGDGENISEKGLDKSGKSDIIKDIENTGIKGIPNIPPKSIDVDKLTIDLQHINDERKHNITIAEAKSFVKNADVSLTKWNGAFENYYSKDGAAFVDMEKDKIRTAFKSDEYDEKTVNMMEVIEKWKNE